ncbi:MAG: ABC transporter substrate-binding protein [Pseudomonadota bacterium]
MKTFLSLSRWICCLLLFPFGAAFCKDLTVVSWGGHFQEVQRQLVYKPFSLQTGTRISALSWDGGMEPLRGNAAWDVVIVDPNELMTGCREGLFAIINWATIGGRQRFISNAVTDCGVGANVYSLVLSYDGSRLPVAPQSWVDLWNVKRFPGKRALRKGPKTNLEIALLADGVKLEEVYVQLATPAGIDRAFKKLSQLKPNVVWWEYGVEPQDLLANGQAVMASAYNIRVSAANVDNQRHLKMVWHNSLNFMDFWVIPKASLQKNEAEQFIAYATSSLVQKSIAEKIPYGQTRKGIAGHVEDSRMQDILGNPNYLSPSLYINEQFWQDNQVKLTERFNQLMLK